MTQKPILKDVGFSLATGMLCLLGFSGVAVAFEWSTTEVQLQYGKLDRPYVTAGADDQDTLTLTFQHASGWKYGDNFFFIDYIDADKDGRDAYGEWYSNFSVEKISKKELSFGPLQDLGVILGINWGADTEVLKFLPGVRFSWDIPGFAFLNLDVTAYIDYSGGVRDGGVPKEDDSFMIDVNGAYPFKIGKASFSIEGHVEYIGRRDNEFGQEVSWWILGQPQFRYDLGEALFGDPNRLFIGTEVQFWINKLGDKDTDEFAVQALAVWRF